MSDTLLIVIPCDPLATPEPARLDAARALVERLCGGADEVTAETSEAPQFHNCMGNFESIYCPMCQTELAIGWWHDEMDRWWDGDRHNLLTTLPCCGAASTLNHLDYHGAQGFACAAIEALNPARALEPDDLKQVEAALGLPVRVIWARI